MMRWWNLAWRNLWRDARAGELRLPVVAVSLGVAALIIVTAGMGSGSIVANNFSGNLLMWAGSLAGIVAVFGLLGFFIGRATE